MQKINILYLSYDGIMDPLGKSQILPYIKRLATKGVNYTLLTLEKKTNLSDKEHIKQLSNELADMGLKWEILKYHRWPPYLAKIRNILSMLFVSLRIANKNNISIVHARSYVTSICAVIIKIFYKTPFLFDMRGFWVDERVEVGTWRNGSFTYRGAKYLENLFLKYSDQIISLTNSGAAEIERSRYLGKRNDNITIVPTCVDLERFSLKQINRSELDVRIKDLTEGHILVYSGSVSTWCMPYEMLFFFKAIKRNFPLTSFLVLTPEKHLFESMLKNKRLEDERICALTVDYESISDYLSLGKAGLAFYKPGLSKKARCPTKVGEYLACGLPVIINSGIGDTEEMINKEGVGVIVQEFSEPEYNRVSKELKIILEDGEALRKRCRAAAEKYFSLDMGVERYMSVYNRLPNACLGK